MDSGCCHRVVFLLFLLACSAAVDSRVIMHLPNALELLQALGETQFLMHLKDGVLLPKRQLLGDRASQNLPPSPKTHGSYNNFAPGHGY
ncbi:hypothetical protein MUK42_24041 [Musa troglodytarum]|uniref:Uncharacterized protein n=1 Tax=Musa troglodytarum TaxID=320322 RepID=A0A9E7JYX3_9LILI|nr:hypothetical protein MUK42_24041 [Musa troglodytarum]